MRAALAIVLVALVVACGGGSGTKPKQPKQPAIDEKQARKDAVGLVEELYDSLGRGTSRDGLFPLLVDPLVVIGPRRTDAMISRSDALVAFGEAFDDRKKVPLRSSGLEVVVSKGGRSAWAFDTVTLDGDTIAAAAILENDEDIWQISTISLAKMYSGKELEAELAKDAVVPPGATAPKQIADDADAAIDRFKAGLVDQARWGADLGARSDAIVVGPTPRDVTKGKKDIKKAWKKRVEAKTRAAISGDIVAGTTADGMLAWVSAPITRGAGDDAPMPLRAFAVFERDGDDWKMILLHEAVAVDQPGAGAAFKKTLPPLIEDKPPEVVDKKADKQATESKTKKSKKTKKPKKKKKKKKKLVEDDE